MVRRIVFLLGLLAATALPAAAQTAETDPLQCWWRSNTAAIRVGEPFSVVLTCAVLETDAVSVVVDQTKLEPGVVQFEPFEMVGGSHGVDLHAGARRFFQYEYKLRLINENFFGKDIPIGDMKLSYKVQSRVGQKSSIQGKDQAYLMPRLQMRVVSLVASEAGDIRDSVPETFNDLDSRSFRANLFTVTSMVLFVLAALLVVLAAVRLVMLFRKPGVKTTRVIGDFSILRAAGAGLAAAQREREAEGWTPAAAAKALASLRLIGMYALGRKVVPVVVDPRLNPGYGPQEDGRILVRAGLVKRKTVAVSGSTTAAMVAREIGRTRLTARAGRIEMLEALEQALSRFTSVGFGPESKADEAALDDAMVSARRVLGRVRIEQTWIMKRLGRGPAAAQMESKVWSR